MRMKDCGCIEYTGADPEVVTGARRAGEKQRCLAHWRPGRGGPQEDVEDRPALIVQPFFGCAAVVRPK